MLFALTRPNLLRQLPNRNGIIRRLTEIVTKSNSISPKADKSGHIFGNCNGPVGKFKIMCWKIQHNCNQLSVKGIKTICLPITPNGFIEL
jgi:hypothetical protein